MDAWIIDGRLTAEMGENITIARLRSPQYCIFRGEEEQVEALFEIDPLRLEFILLTTYSIANYVLKTIPKKRQT